MGAFVAPTGQELNSRARCYRPDHQANLILAKTVHYISMGWNLDEPNVNVSEYRMQHLNIRTFKL